MKYEKRKKKICEAYHVILCTENLVKFAERVRVAKIFLVDGHRLVCHLEHELG